MNAEEGVEEDVRVANNGAAGRLKRSTAQAHEERPEEPKVLPPPAPLKRSADQAHEQCSSTNQSERPQVPVAPLKPKATQAPEECPRDNNKLPTEPAEGLDTSVAAEPLGPFEFELVREQPKPKVAQTSKPATKCEKPIRTEKFYPVDEGRLAEFCRSHAEAIVRHFFPHANKNGKEWVMADTSGSKGESLDITVAGEKAGLWHDFAIGQGGRLPKLLMEHFGLRFPEAVELIERAFGVNLRAAAPLSPKPKRVAGARADAPTSAPKTDAAFDWSRHVAQLSKSKAQAEAQQRGYRTLFCQWLKDQNLVGSYKGHLAFPVSNKEGQIVGCHYYLEESGKWRYSPGCRVTPLVIGDLSSAIRIHVFESYWDALDFADKTNFEQIDGCALVITRGAGNGHLVKGLLPQSAQCTVYIWPQRDIARENGKVPSTLWLDTVKANAGRSVRVPWIPNSHPERDFDFNDWTRELTSAGRDRDWIGRQIISLSEKALVETHDANLAPDQELGAPQISEADLAAALNAAESESGDGNDGEAGVAAVVQSLDAYYDQPRKEYVVKTPPLAGPNYQSHTETQFKRDLRFLGIASKPPSGELLSHADIVIKQVQETKYVNYVGALSGKQCGFYYENGTRFLVTSEPKIIEPVSGEFSTIRKVITNLLAGEQEPCAVEQSHSFYGWLQRAYCGLRNHKFAPGQALALAGPAESGKSLMQLLITEILGGRCAKPALFLQGRTDFNGELFEAEHLMLEDERATISHAARMALGTNIKNLVANRTHPCHAKHRPIVNLAPWWRLTISINDRPERLLILPPLVEDMADKIILLRATQSPMPMLTTTAEERETFWNTLVGELPAFLHWLVNKYVVPAEWRNPRFGVRAFHHPILLTELEELSPAIALLGLIDTAHIWEVGSAVWEGTALELRAQLLEHRKTARDADRLLSWTNACGQYLNDLAKMRPGRVKKTSKGGNLQRFEIWPEVPQKDAA